MNILFLTAQLPYPPDSGGLIKSHQLVEFLAARYQLSIACLLKSESDHHYLAEFEAKVAPVPVFSLSLNIPRTGRNFLRSCIAGVPLTIYRNKSRVFGDKVRELCQGKDVLFVDHYLMSQYVPEDFTGRVVVHQHNAEFLMWSRKAEQEQNFLMRLLLSFEAQRIKRYELDMCARVDAVLAAENDQQQLINAGAKGDNFFETLHPGEEVLLAAPPIDYAQTTPSLLFVGTLTWEANVDGLEWFAQSIWPLILAQLPNTRLTVAGRCTEAIRSRLEKLMPEAKILGFVDDLELLYQKHRVLVAPLRFGSGVKIKVVNALHRGLPTVTTSVGAEGLKVQHQQQMMIADEPQAFAQDVVTLLNEASLWQRLSEQSRQWTAQNYTWKIEQQNIKRSLGEC